MSLLSRSEERIRIMNPTMNDEKPGLFMPMEVQEERLEWCI